MKITFTPKAEAFIRRMVRIGGGPQAGFRLEVSPGGCSGLASQFDVEAEPQPADVVVQASGVRVFLSPDSCRLLDGATVDFVDTRTDSGFSILTPNSPRACSTSIATLPAVVTIEVHRIRHVGSDE